MRRAVDIAVGAGWTEEEFRALAFEVYEEAAVEGLDLRTERVEGPGSLRGVRVVHDGPHRFIGGRCPCGVMDLGVVPPLSPAVDNPGDDQRPSL